MKHSIIINAHGKAQYRQHHSLYNDLKNLFAQINNWDMQPTKYFMNESDYLDIIKWSEEEDQ